MSRFLMLALVVMLLGMPIGTSSSENSRIVLTFTEGSTSYTVDGAVKTMDSAPVVRNGRVFLLVRFVAEECSASLDWDAGTKTTTIHTSKGETIKMTLGSATAYRNGKPVQIDSSNPNVVPFTVNSRFMCPLRFTGELFGATGPNDILWDQKTRTATLSIQRTSDEQAEITPPTGFVKVPANPKLGINEPFYVSKYEMKIKGIKDGNQKYDEKYVAESRADGTPWIGMTMAQAKAECKALGDGYSLITNAEWMTIAHDIESNPKNWSDSQTHQTGRSNAKLNIGNVCRYGPRGNGGRIDKEQEREILRRRFA